MKRNFLIKIKAAVLLILLAFAFASTTPAQKSVQEKLRRKYLNAIMDAAVAEPEEISKNLTVISESNAKLIWKPGERRVLVVTWTSWNGYDNKEDQTLPLERELWVTVVPEVKEFCTKRKWKNLTLRLEQLMGLPPNNGKTKFAELWVDPKDLFRPSPDPEITDYEAELEYPTSKHFVISDEYKMWFCDKRCSSYAINGFPWTRLGYTYDWGNPKSEVGLSEFVIRQGATVIVGKVHGTSDYCSINQKGK